MISSPSVFAIVSLRARGQGIFEDAARTLPCQRRFNSPKRSELTTLEIELDESQVRNLSADELKAFRDWNKAPSHELMNPLYPSK